MKTLVCFVSHVVNDALIKRFLSIKEAISNKYDIKYISPNVYIEDNRINEYIVNLNLPKDLKDNLNNNHIKGQLIFINIFNMFKKYQYDYYWLIEGDVTINNKNFVEGWRNLFNFYNDNTSDLICSKFHKWIDYKGYQLRYPKENLEKYNMKFTCDELSFGFYSICRLSRKLFNLIIEYYESYDGYLEYIVSTIAETNKLKISSLTDDKFDIEDTLLINMSSTGINLGSNTWRKDYLLSHILDYPENIILHPIKLY